MRIGINATFRLHGGGFVHLCHLLDAWHASGADKRYPMTILTRTENVAALPLPSNSAIRITPVQFRSFGGHLRPVWEQFMLPGLAARSEFDVLYCPGGVSPARSSVPSVVVLRNAAPFAEGVSWKTEGIVRASSHLVLGATMRLSARAAARTIFISKFFRNLFVSRFGFDARRGDIIYHGRDGLKSTAPDQALLSQLGLDSPFILSVSHLYPYKNMPALIRGYGSVRHFMKRRNLRLVLVGKPSSEAYGAYLRQLIREEGLQDWVLMPGAVRHDQIGALLGACHYFVFQSLCENCPNTLLEALAAGVPIASSEAGVMPEICGNAAVYFDPLCAADIAKSLVRMAEDSDLRAELREKALTQSLRFPTWREVGERTLESLMTAVENNNEGRVHAIAGGGPV